MNRLRITCILQQQKNLRNPKAADEHSPWLHISFKICSQLYCELIRGVRSVKRRVISMVDFVEIIEIIRSLALTIQLRHLGGGMELSQALQLRWRTAEIQF
jgi:hypothetical protein